MANLSQRKVERAMGIEPTAQAWEAWVLPLYDARLALILVGLSGAGKWMRNPTSGETGLHQLTPRTPTCRRASFARP
jgi:hypothetical protein